MEEQNFSEVDKENLRETITTAISCYSDTWLSQCPDTDKLLSALMDSIQEWENMPYKQDPRDEALDEITRENCRGLSFGNNNDN